MGFFDRFRNQNQGSVVVDDVLLRALLNGDTLTKEQVLTIPSVAECIDLIAGMIASMPIKMYRWINGEVREIEKDTRVKVLNDSTGDILTPFQLKKNLVTDFLLDKGGYAIIEKRLNDVVGLYYQKPEKVTAYEVNISNTKRAGKFMVGTESYADYEMIKLCRNSRNGISGQPVTDDIAKLLETAYRTILFELTQVKTGGAKKGFLKSDKKLSAESMQELKTAWRNLYEKGTENAIVLNNGLDFKEASANSVEMQLNEKKKTLSDEIRSVFHIYSDFSMTFKTAIYPIIKQFEDELNAVLLLEEEKKNKYFEFDVKEIVRASIKERYEANGIALKDGWKTINEVRADENLNKIDGMDVLNLGLSAVLYDTETEQFFVANTGTTMQRGEQDEELPQSV